MSGNSAGLGSLDIDFNAVFSGIDFAGSAIRNAAARGMEMAMRELLDEAKSSAPKLSGEFRQKARFEVVTTSYGVSGTVIFSALKHYKRGWAFDVALKLHEYPKAFKNPSTPGTGPKFLERPLKARSARYRELIATEIAKELRK
ncbi:hypothetical protein [Paenibacillus silvisoli]|uniref:hypothetical protein n=1 Tax=Paenibacillus silvisoli TaxID=3110539 RepID=UPI0028063C81|nr:hypothetical protein [Paenibacillus silvisoli]